MQHDAVAVLRHPLCRQQKPRRAARATRRIAWPIQINNRQGGHIFLCRRSKPRDLFGGLTFHAQEHQKGPDGLGRAIVAQHQPHGIECLVLGK